jgi:hypothetical protein
MPIIGIIIGIGIWFGMACMGAILGRAFAAARSLRRFIRQSGGSSARQFARCCRMNATARCHDCFAASAL